MKLDLTVSRKQREFIEADADEVFYGERPEAENPLRR